MYFLHKNNSIQTVSRNRFNRDKHVWVDWQEDVVPVKGLFGLETYENKIVFHKDGTWYEDKGIKKDEDDNNEVEIVREPDGAIRV